MNIFRKRSFFSWKVLQGTEMHKLMINLCISVPCTVNFRFEKGTFPKYIHSFQAILYFFKDSEHTVIYPLCVLVCYNYFIRLCRSAKFVLHTCKVFTLGRVTVSRHRLNSTVKMLRFFNVSNAKTLFSGSFKFQKEGSQRVLAP